MRYDKYVAVTGDEYKRIMNGDELRARAHELRQAEKHAEKLAESHGSSHVLKVTEVSTYSRHITKQAAVSTQLDSSHGWVNE